LPPSPHLLGVLQREELDQVRHRLVVLLRALRDLLVHGLDVPEARERHPDPLLVHPVGQALDDHCGLVHRPREVQRRAVEDEGVGHAGGRELAGERGRRVRRRAQVEVREQRDLP
jgi:hypothetical protein